MKKKIFLFLLTISFQNALSQENEILKININEISFGSNKTGEIQIDKSIPNDVNTKLEILITQKNGFLILKNDMKAKGTYSYGGISNITIEQFKDLLDTQFYWNFNNSYDDKKGTALVEIIMLKNKFEDKNKLMCIVFMYLEDNKILKYDGFINSNDFIRLTDK